MRRCYKKMLDKIFFSCSSTDRSPATATLRAEFISFCTDSEPIDLSTATNAHPRAFGSFPRILAKYVREEKVITLEDGLSYATNQNNLLLQLKGLSSTEDYVNQGKPVGESLAPPPAPPASTNSVLDQME